MILEGVRFILEMEKGQTICFIQSQMYPIVGRDFLQRAYPYIVETDIFAVITNVITSLHSIYQLVQNSSYGFQSH